MYAGLHGSRPTAVRWRTCVVLLCVLLILHGGAAVEIESDLLFMRVQREVNGVPDIVDLNPMTFFEEERADFACFCTFPGNTGVQVQLLHNQYPIKTSECPALYHSLTVTISNEGDYNCKSSYNTTTTYVSESKELKVLDPEDINAPPKQYALRGSAHTLQCNTSIDEQALISWYAANGTKLADGPYHIPNVSLTDEGEYECRVYFDNNDVLMNKPVSLFVIVPPVITHPLPTQLNLTDNSHKSLAVEFESRYINNTSVTWYHDGRPIQNEIQTEFVTEYKARSTLNIGVVSRSDAGTYLVEVSNNFSSIPPEQRVASSALRLRVAVLPAPPVSVVTRNLSKSVVEILWKLLPQHSDEEADAISVFLNSRDGVQLTRYELSGSSTRVQVAVVPGMWYGAQIVARNEDGAAPAVDVQFRAQSAAPNVTSVKVKRLNATSFNISTSLLYTGGGGVTHFSISFRRRNGTEWSEALNVQAYTSDMEQRLHWYGIVTDDGLGVPSELHVAVVNDDGHQSSPHTIQEVLAPLSAPSTPILLSASPDSLTLSFTLPREGTPPILYLIIDFTAPFISQWRCVGAESRGLGAQLDCTVPRLSSNTQYTLSVYGVGHAGRGNSTSKVTFSTTAIDNSLPTWVIAVVAVVVAMTFLIVALAALLVVVHCCKLHHKKRLYHFSSKKATEQTAPKPLDPSHAMVNRPRKPSVSALSEVERGTSPSSTLTPPCHSTPSTTATFKYETASSSSCSNSEVSEAQSPTYTYRISPQPTCPISMQQSYHSLQRAGGVGTMPHAHSMHSTRESLASCPPAPTHCATNV